MSDDEQLKVAWAALLMEDWRCLTRAASKLLMEKIWRCTRSPSSQI